jgi:ADP-heptose:LPS heptosyltransferase
MSEARVIDLDWKDSSNRIYSAKAEIFEDTNNLALIITIKNKKTDETLVREWFNIEILKLTEKQENWLAYIIAQQMLKSAIAGRQEKSNEVKESWKDFLSTVENL